MSTSDDRATDSRSTVSSVPTEQFLAEGFTLDLSQRPSLRDLGLKPGERNRVRDLPEGENFEVAITFADGHTLSTTAQVMIAKATTEGRPTLISLNTDTMTAEQTRSRIEDVAADLDLPARAQDELQNFVAASTDGQFGRRVVTAPLSGPDKLQCEVVVERPDEFHLTFHITLGQ